MSRESDTRAVCGSEEFDPPPTHKGPQMGAFIVKVIITISEPSVKLARIGWRGLTAFPSTMAIVPDNRYFILFFFELHCAGSNLRSVLFSLAYFSSGGKATAIVAQ